MPIGDINSRAPGSAARYNDGKAAVQLIPAHLIADHFARYAVPAAEPNMIAALHALGRWQFREVDNVTPLHEALWFSGATWEETAAVFDYGRRKYADWNWSKGMPWSQALASAMRHAIAMLRGEANDPESGLSHAGHFGCNMIMLLHYANAYTEGDDRPTCPSYTPEAYGFSVLEAA